jgi:hypothetical protein
LPPSTGWRVRRASLVLASMLAIMQLTLPAAYSYKASDQYLKKLLTKKGRLEEIHNTVPQINSLKM